MSFRNTALLAVLVAALGAYVYWVERPAIEAETAPRQLVDFDPTEVDRFELTTRDGPIEARRTDDGTGWRITRPVDTRADAQAIDTLLRTAAEAEDKREVAETGADLAPFGLDPPDAALALFSGERPVGHLEIGRGTPIGFHAYARRKDDSAVRLTGGTVRAALLKSLTDLREKRLLDVRDADVTALTITRRDEPPARVERTSEGWQLTAPDEARADESTIQSLLAALQALRAVEFLPGSAGSTPHGLASPSVEVIAEHGSGTSRVLLGDEVKRADKTLVAAAIDGRDEVYLVGTHVPASLGRSASDLRDKHLVPFAAEDVERIEVRLAGEPPFELQRDGRDWTIPGEPTVDPLLVRRLADDMIALEGLRVVEPAAAPSPESASAPTLELVLSGSAVPSPATIRIRRVSEEPVSYEATVEGSAVTYEIASTAFDRAAKRPADLLPSD